MFIPDPGPWILIFFYPGSQILIPDPGVEKSPDPGSATLDGRLAFFIKTFIKEVAEGENKCRCRH
jgi:hypothetical protein